jgi:hypothetical protein
MSTALIQHHPRSHWIAAGAAAAAVAALIGFNVSQDDAPASVQTPAFATVLPHFDLSGGTHEQGSWQHAGTVSGGHAPRTLAP